MFIKAIHSSELEVGRNIKSTKKKFTWKFSIDNVDQEIALFVSSMSGKKQVTHNGRNIHDESSYFSDFRFLHYIQRCLVTIAPKRDSYELFLDNVPFSEYYNTRNSFKNQSPQHKTLKNADNEGYDLSPLKDSEIPKQTQQPQHMKLKLTVPKEQKQITSQQNESSKTDSHWWKSGVNEFGTPSTSGNDQNDNIFGKFGFTFETPEKEKQLQSQKIPNNQTNQNSNIKPNPFIDQTQNSWNSQPQNQPQINQFGNQPGFNQVQQNSQQKQQISNPIKTSSVILQQPQQNNNQHYYQNQNTQFYQQQNNVQIQPQFNQRQSLPSNPSNIYQSQQQSIYQQPIQQVANIKQQQNMNLLDFNDEPQQLQQSQPRSNNIQNQSQDLRKAASSNNFNQFQSNTQTKSQFNLLDSYQSPQQQYPQYRTTSSYQPSSQYQQKQVMPKDIEDLFNAIDDKQQYPLQKRSTPFDDDDIFA